jgi:hypothetical protein
MPLNFPVSGDNQPYFQANFILDPWELIPLPRPSNPLSLAARVTRDASLSPRGSVLRLRAMTWIFSQVSVA